MINSRKALIGTELKRFLRDYRRETAPMREICAILQSVEYPVNVGSIFRLADGAGLKELILTGITPDPHHPAVEKVGRSKADNLPWRYEKEATEAVRQLQAEGYQVVALELTEDALPYHQFAYHDKLCFVVGHEDHGVTKQTLSVCDAAVFVPMYGKGLSLNVHVALSIAVYHALHCA